MSVADEALMRNVRDAVGGRRGAADPLTAAGGFSLALVIVIALMLPRDLFTFNAGSVRLTGLRITLILLVIPAIMLFMRRQGGKLYAFDWLFFGFAGWTALAVLIKYGPGGVETAGQFLLETAVVYLVVQGAVVRVAQIRALFAFLATVITVLGMMAIFEISTDQHYWYNVIRQAAGLEPVTWALGNRRFGLIRATTIFLHPILFGVICAVPLAFVWYLERNVVLRLFKVGAITVATGSTMSSGPILVLLLQYLFIGIELTTRRIKRRFTLMCIGVGSFLMLVHFTAPRGMFSLVSAVVLNPASAHYRRLIWLNGQQDVLRNPVFGIRPENWTRPMWMTGSIDNFWLYSAMLGGLPAVICLIGAMVVIARRLYLPGDTPPVMEALRRGWAFTLLAMSLVGATVHFYDNLRPYMALMIGLGAAIVRMRIEHEAMAAQAPQAARPDEPARPARPRTWL